VYRRKENNCCISGTIGEANIDRPGGDYKFDNVMGADVTLSSVKQYVKTKLNVKHGHL
jgi:hypothetical protein